MVRLVRVSVEVWGASRDVINKARQNLWLPTGIIFSLVPAYKIYGWVFNIGLFRIFTYLSTISEFWMIFDESSIKAKVSKVLPLLIFRNVFSPLIPCLFFFFFLFLFFFSSFLVIFPSCLQNQLAAYKQCLRAWALCRTLNKGCNFNWMPQAKVKICIIRSNIKNWSQDLLTDGTKIVSSVLSKHNINFSGGLEATRP